MGFHIDNMDNRSTLKDFICAKSNQFIIYLGRIFLKSILC